MICPECGQGSFTFEIEEDPIPKDVRDIETGKLIKDRKIFTLTGQCFNRKCGLIMTGIGVKRGNLELIDDRGHYEVKAEI